MENGTEGVQVGDLPGPEVIGAADGVAGDEARRS
jgi:hypothetical protein